MGFLSCRERLVEEVNDLVNIIIRKSNLEERVRDFLRGQRDPLEVDKGVVIVALGKASVAMARGALSVMGERVVGGVVAVPSGAKYNKGELSPLEVVEGSHPTPDERSVKAAEAVMEWAQRSKGVGGLLALVSGGGSAIVEKPMSPLTVDDIVSVNKELLSCGASIREINTVRKHLSMIKGGRLAAIAYPAPLLGLYASDVPGDKLEDIASGPTVPDPTTYDDALRVLEMYDIKDKVPEKVVEVLERGRRGEIDETPKPGDPIFKNVKNVIVAKNLDILNDVEKHLVKKGYKVLKLTSRLEGESREVAKVLASIALEAYKSGVPDSPPLAVILGGETSVTVKGRGKGGRNQELVLSWATRVNFWEGELDDMVIMAMDTDGIDGASDAAGGYLFPSDIGRSKTLGLDPNEFLRNNDSYTFLKRLGRLIVTGPTGSNLNSIVVVLIGKC